MAEIEPTPAITVKFDGVISFIDSASKYDSITLAKRTIKRPST